MRGPDCLLSAHPREWHRSGVRILFCEFESTGLQGGALLQTASSTARNRRTKDVLPGSGTARSSPACTAAFVAEVPRFVHRPTLDCAIENAGMQLCGGIQECRTNILLETIRGFIHCKMSTK
jgi:hypothetical protein